MGKAVKNVALGIALVGGSILTAGAGIPILSGLATSVLGAASYGVGALGLAGAGATAFALAGGATLGLGATALSALGPKAPKASPAQLSRLTTSIDPGAPRMMVLGNTAFPVAIRYVEPSGTNQEYIDYVICCAAHEVQSFDEIWFEDRQAWTSGGGVTAHYSGYLTIDTITEAGSGAYHTVNDGTNWGSSQRLTGCATMKLRIKRTGVDKKADSPLVNGLPSRVTIRGKGMPTYDPRQDSTNGGSGTQRPDDRTTWSYGASDPKQGENPALQILSYLLGWTISGRLSVGKGIPASRIDLDSFIDAANVCDESVTLAAGGTQYRYQAHGVFSEADSPLAVLEALCAACNGTLRDANGKLRLDILQNDLATYVDLDDDDVLGAFTWEQTPSVETFPNIIRGKFTDPSDNALYQMVDYPEVALSSIDGIDRIVTMDMPLVQNAARAQRLAKQALQRMQYPGVFRAEFKAKAWAVQVGSVVRLTFSALGFTNKLFRVVEQTISLDGVCAMTLREENAAIYAWDANELAPVTPAAPTVYDPANAPLIRAALQDPLTRGADRPSESYQGQGWIDDNGYPHVHHGFDVSFNGTVVTFNGDQASMPWVRSRDQAAQNFDQRNDRNGDPIDAPTIASDGTAIDHTVNTDGSVDLSIEWSWGGTNSDIDGFEVTVYSASSSSAYVIGTSTTAESVISVPSNRRALIIQGVPADRYYTFGVNAYRVVDPDVDSSGIIRSSVVQPAGSGENPYQPSSTVAFAGNITGTVGGRAAATIAATIGSDGNIAAGKVTATSLSADAINEIVSATASGVTATDGGALLLTLSGVTVKVSQSGYVHLVLTANVKLTLTAGFTSSILYGRLQRSPAGSGTWTEIHSWLMARAQAATYVDDGVGAFADNQIIWVSAASQYVDVPPSDGDYDYRWLASKTPDGTGSTAASVNAGQAENAYGLALSVKTGV